MTEMVTPTIGKAEKVFKDLVWDTAVKGALIYFKLDFWPVNAFAELVGDKVYEGLRLKFDIPAIKFLNDNHRKDFDKSAVTLLIIEETFGAGSDEYKKARENAKQALSKYGRFGASY